MLMENGASIQRGVFFIKIIKKGWGEGAKTNSQLNKTLIIALVCFLSVHTFLYSLQLHNHIAYFRRNLLVCIWAGLGESGGKEKNSDSALVKELP